MLVRGRLRREYRSVALVLCALSIASCRARSDVAGDAQIEFTRVPEARAGGPDAVDGIEGRVNGAQPGQRIVLFAKTDIWWVQPLSTEPFTQIAADFSWKGTTHFGTEYAALLVESHYYPPARTSTLPQKGGAIKAVTRVDGRSPKAGGEAYRPPFQQRKDLRLGGFDWEIRGQPSDRGGSMNDYDPANAWIDDRGRLHLRITRGVHTWKCAEVRLADPLGYGTYSFTVDEISHLEAGAVLGFYTFDHTAPGQNFREMNIEFSRWGDPFNRNAQFAVQPYYIPANVVRFEAPPGRLTSSIRWTHGRVNFRTVQGKTSRVVADYSFTSGVPSPGGESVYIALYSYGRARYPLTKETEVVVGQFEYIP